MKSVISSVSSLCRKMRRFSIIARSIITQGNGRRMEASKVLVGGSCYQLLRILVSIQDFGDNAHLTSHPVEIRTAYTTTWQRVLYQSFINWKKYHDYFHFLKWKLFINFHMNIRKKILFKLLEKIVLSYYQNGRCANQRIDVH